jgi:hypothetical protein
MPAMAAGRPHRSTPPQAPPTCPGAMSRHLLPSRQWNRPEPLGIIARDAVFSSSATSKSTTAGSSLARLTP